MRVAASGTVSRETASRYLLLCGPQLPQPAGGCSLRSAAGRVGAGTRRGLPLPSWCGVVRTTRPKTPRTIPAWRLAWQPRSGSPPLRSGRPYSPTEWVATHPRRSSTYHPHTQNRTAVCPRCRPGDSFLARAPARPRVGALVRSVSGHRRRGGQAHLFAAHLGDPQSLDPFAFGQPVRFRLPQALDQAALAGAGRQRHPQVQPAVGAAGVSRGHPAPLCVVGAGPALALTSIRSMGERIAICRRASSM